jgi:co-chaperonin GroES (HSP10)
MQLILLNDNVLLKKLRVKSEILDLSVMVGGTRGVVALGEVYACEFLEKGVRVYFYEKMAELVEVDGEELSLLHRDDLIGFLQ